MLQTGALIRSFAHASPKSCPDFAEVLPRLCLSLAQTLPKSCPDFTQVLPRLHPLPGSQKIHFPPCARGGIFGIICAVGREHKNLRKVPRKSSGFSPTTHSPIFDILALTGGESRCSRLWPAGGLSYFSELKEKEKKRSKRRVKRKPPPPPARARGSLPVDMLITRYAWHFDTLM